MVGAQFLRFPFLPLLTVHPLGMLWAVRCPLVLHWKKKKSDTLEASESLDQVNPKLWLKKEIIKKNSNVPLFYL